MTFARFAAAGPLAILALVAGCDEPKKPSKTAAQAPIQTRETLNKTTQNVLKMEPELAKGAILYDGVITDKNPISISGEAYVSSVGRLAVMKVNQDIEIYKNLEMDSKPPKDYDEFMAKIIKENNTQLPMLPYYQEYGYDEKNCKLVVLEYPAKKAQREKERDAK